MYRCMLKKVNDAPVATQVSLDTYGPIRSKYVRSSWRRPDPPASHEDTPVAFVLFHDDLRTAAQEKGLLMNSTSEALWRVIVRNVEVFDPNEAEGDADVEKRRNFAACKGYTHP